MHVRHLVLCLALAGLAACHSGGGGGYSGGSSSSGGSSGGGSGGSSSGSGGGSGGSSGGGSGGSSGGGSGGSSGGGSGGSSGGSTTTGTAVVTIAIPISSGHSAGRAQALAASERPASYVSAKTLSLSVRIVSVDGNETPPVSAAVDVNGTTCPTVGTSLNCAVSLDVPPGSDTFQVITYALAGEGGTPLSQGDGTASIVIGATNSVAVTLHPVVASVVVTMDPPTSSQTAPGTFTATITAKDSAGDDITGDDTFATPISVLTTDVDGHVTSVPSLPAQLASAADNTITFTYDGMGHAASYPFTLYFGQELALNYLFTSSLQHLYVASESNAVYVYTIQADGSITGPDRTLAGPHTKLSAPTSIAVDDLGDLYVVNQFSNVTEYAPGADGDTAPFDTLLDGLNPNYVSYEGGAFITYPNRDGANATVRIHDPGNPNGIPPYHESYAYGFASYQAFLGGPGYFCTTVQQPANGGRGSVTCLALPITWVSDFSDPNADIVNCNIQCTAVDTLTFSAGGAIDLKFHEDGRLTVASEPYTGHPSPSVDTYGMGNQALLTSITGSNTLLSSPVAIAFDANDNIYVVDPGLASGQGSVHVYAHDANGNVAPIHNIAGLNATFGIAIGK